jgi:hypothetical protein
MNLNEEILKTRKAMENRNASQKNFGLETWLDYCMKESRRKK